MPAEEVCKNRRSNNNTLINIARVTKKAEVSTYNEKSKEGPKREVSKFCKNKKLTRIFIAITTTTNTIKYRKNKKNNKFSNN